MAQKQTNKSKYLSAIKGFRSELPKGRTIFVFFVIMIILAGADLVTKWAAFDYLATQGVWEKPVIDGFFNLVMRENAGAAWSTFEGRRVLLVAISVIALIVVLGIFLTGQIKRKMTFVATSFFGAGIIGNLYDRIFNEGRVRDFLDFYLVWGDKEYHWPAFNLADSLLCVAVVMLIISSFLQARQEIKEEKCLR